MVKESVLVWFNLALLGMKVVMLQMLMPIAKTVVWITNLTDFSFAFLWMQTAREDLRIMERDFVFCSLLLVLLGINRTINRTRIASLAILRMAIEMMVRPVRLLLTHVHLGLRIMVMGHAFLFI